jgi:hypothetical protein
MYDANWFPLNPSHSIAIYISHAPLIILWELEIGQNKTMYISHTRSSSCHNSFMLIVKHCVVILLLLVVFHQFLSKSSQTSGIMSAFLRFGEVVHHECIPPFFKFKGMTLSYVRRCTLLECLV